MSTETSSQKDLGFDAKHDPLFAAALAAWRLKSSGPAMTGVWIAAGSFVKTYLNRTLRRVQPGRGSVYAAVSWSTGRPMDAVHQLYAIVANEVEHGHRRLVWINRAREESHNPILTRYGGCAS
jgi:hypothetical protein